MFTYEDGGLRVAECCWDQVAGPVGADLVRLLYRNEPEAGDRVRPCPTFRVDVCVVENPLRGPLEQLMYVLELDTARRAQRGMALHIRCGVHFHPPLRDLERFLQFAADERRWNGCPPAGLARLTALSEAGRLRLSTASDARGRVLAQHCYVSVGSHARFLDGAFARAVDGSAPEDAEAADCADACLLYWDIVTLHDFDVETLDLPVLDVANPGAGLRGRALTLYDTERALSAAGRRALASKGIADESRLGLDDFARFVHAQSHVLARNAALTFQQAANEPDSTAPARAAQARLDAGLEARPWIQHVNKPQSRPAYLMTLSGHTAYVNACAFSPDGSRIVSASTDRSLKIWDTTIGAELATLLGHTGSVSDCDFSSDGSRVVSASDDRTLRLWDVVTGVELSVLTGHTREVTACAFSPDGSRVASGSWDATLRLWDTETGLCLATLEGHTGSVSGCAFSPDGKRIVSASSDRTLRLWDADGGIEIARLEGHTGWVYDCKFSPDGRCIASASDDKTVRVWDGATGAAVITIAGHDHAVEACAFSPDGTRILATDFCTLRAWDSRTGAPLAALTGHPEPVFDCAYSPDGSRIVSASFDGTLMLWDAQAAATLDRPGRPTSACAISPDGSRVVSASGRHLILFDAGTGAELSAWEAGWQVGACAFSPDGRQIVSGDGDGSVSLWNARTGTMLRKLRGHICTPTLEKTGGVKSCAFSPDGRRIVSASNDHTLKLWDARTGAELATLTGHTGGILDCAFSPDGRRVISASYDRTLRLWDSETGTAVTTLTGHASSVHACGFSPDGRLAVSGAFNGVIKMWDVQAGREVATLEESGTQVSNELTFCAFSADGSHVVTGSRRPLRLSDLMDLIDPTEEKRDGAVRVWRVGGGPHEGDRTLEYPLSGGCEAAAWSPNARELVTFDTLGNMLILRPRNLSRGSVFVTPWEYRPRRRLPWRGADETLGVGCPLCGTWSEIPPAAVGAAISCPCCGERLTLNPFTIAADWRPIAAAWTARPKGG